MSQFEYFVVAVSIILALGISRLLDAVLPALQSPVRYWTHFLWIVQKLFNHILWWWGLWAISEFENWHLGWFLYTLSGPLVLYLQATALVTTSPKDIGSWEDHFFTIRRWFFAGNIAICAILLLGRILNPVPLLPSVTIGLIVLAVIGITGMAVENRRMHLGLVIAALTVQLLGLGSAMFGAGSY